MLSETNFAGIDFRAFLELCYLLFRYRGYAIEHLAQFATFEEVVFLLIHGDLPSPSQLESTEAEFNSHADVPQQIKSKY